MVSTNLRGDGGAAYRSTLRHRQHGAHRRRHRGLSLAGPAAPPCDNVVPFPRYTAFTRTSLNDVYTAYSQDPVKNWTRAAGLWSTNWNERPWRGGDYLCGNAVVAYNSGGPRRPLRRPLLHVLPPEGARAPAPPRRSASATATGTGLSPPLLRAQYRNVINYTTFGEVRDDFCEATSVTCNYGSPFFTSAMGGLVMTPALFNPKPVAIGAAVPQQVAEGCAGGNNGLVTFNHRDSFHPNNNARILNYQWDVNAADGLWWNVAGRDPDFNTADAGQTFTYRYSRSQALPYVATLRVVDNGNPAQAHETTVPITVAAAANVPPSAAHGGPYVIEVGQDLQLQGNASDGNLACNDALTTLWDLDNDGAFDDANGPTGGVPWASLQNLPRNQPVRIRLQVTDRAGLSATAESTLTIFPPTPVAVAVANPNPAACRQNITFDGSQSRHPNPNRTLASFQWDVNGDGAFDGGNANPQFVFAYDRFGTYDVRLRVTDDLGRSADADVRVTVNQGNQAPVARASRANYQVLEGENLTLDAAASTDPDQACGDRIAAYEWDLNGDGDFNDAGVDQSGVQAQVPWAVLQANLRWPADPASGLPTNTVTLRVRDNFGVTSTARVTVTIFRARPVAVVSQNPDPAPINLVTGSSNPTLDGRESSSPVPGMQIARYDWDLNDDGTFEVANRPFVEFVKVFAPVPDPNTIPATFVRLRVTERAEPAPARSATAGALRRAPDAAHRRRRPERTARARVPHPLGDGVMLDGCGRATPTSGDLRRRRCASTAGRSTGDAARADPTRDPRRQPTAGDHAVARPPAELAEAGITEPGEYTVMLEVEDTTGVDQHATPP